MDADRRFPGVALAATGRWLAVRGTPPTLRVYLVGGAAAILSGLFEEGRTTVDCDAMAFTPEGRWNELVAAAAEIAAQFRLSPDWLNARCRSYMWCMAPGWLSRCERVMECGPLEVWVASRQDFILSKVMGAPVRPQDLADLRAVRPTADELTLAGEHLDRLERESRDPDLTLDRQRSILRALRAPL